MAGLFGCFAAQVSQSVYSLWILVYGVPLPLQIQRALGEFARALKSDTLLWTLGTSTKQPKTKGEIDSSEQAMRGFGSGGPISDRTQCGRTPGGPPPIDHC